MNKGLNLKKYNLSDDEKNFDEVIKKLQNALENVEEISGYNINEIVNYQDEDGGFRPFNGKWGYGDVDCGIYYTKTPSILCTLILINADILNIYKAPVEIMKKAFEFMKNNGIAGMGYDKVWVEVQNINLLLENGIKIFLEKYKNEYNEFALTFYSWIEDYKKSNYKTDDINRMLDNYLNNYYIAYGSNLNAKQMESRCPCSTPLKVEFLEGYKLEFNECLTVIKDEEYKTPVVIYKINNQNERTLDEKEGVNSNTYRKEYIRLKINGQKRFCLIYIMNDIKERRDVVPSNDYMVKCLEGYDRFLFDKWYLEDALLRVKNKSRVDE